jgi:glycosyltransferase involved in cell wall biosynthesis
MKISFIATVLNEEDNIRLFLNSLLNQTVMPYDVVIVDGGSRDNTVEVMRDFAKRSALPFKFIISTKEGNRSVGRNEAIKKAQGEIILISDPGCILDKNWVKEIIKPFENKDTDVVAGYYNARYENIFEKCLVPYVLVMPDKIDEREFLPATRSMAIKKNIWEEIGKFDERYSHNEDYVFARKLRSERKRIVFAKKAIVSWIPRKNLAEAYTMFRRFAYGDREASILRPKVAAIIFRYILGVVLLVFALATNNTFLLSSLVLIFIVYLVWAIAKNYRYIKNWRAIYYLPIIQVLSDVAILIGTLQATLNR